MLRLKEQQPSPGKNNLTLIQANITVEGSAPTDRDDLVGSVGVGGARGTLGQQRQQAARHKALPRRLLARARPGEAVRGQNGHSHREHGDARPVLGHQPRCGAASSQHHYEAGMHLGHPHTPTSELTLPDVVICCLLK